MSNPRTVTGQATASQPRPGSWPVGPGAPPGRAWRCPGGGWRPHDGGNTRGDSALPGAVRSYQGRAGHGPSGSVTWPLQRRPRHNSIRQETMTNQDLRPGCCRLAGGAEGQEWPAARGLDTTVPNVARIYDYLLGGKDNFQADRDAACEVMRQIPNSAVACRDNRAFLGRAVHYLAAEKGIRLSIPTNSITQSGVFGRGCSEAAQRPTLGPVVPACSPPSGSGHSVPSAGGGGLQCYGSIPYRIFHVPCTRC